MKISLVLAAVLVLAVSSSAQGEDCPRLCGSQGDGLVCPFNQCCSGDGKCGLTVKHCGENCQGGPCQPSVNQRCGRKFRNKKCTNNYCCSADGFCGLGMRYCGAGCQSGFCLGTTCSETNKCSNNQCCGPTGICGVGNAYCGDDCIGGPCYYPRAGTVAANTTLATLAGASKTVTLTGPPTPPSPSPKCPNLCGQQNGNMECPDNQCCGKDGKCGIEKGHCGPGCQSGPCQPSMKQRCGYNFGGNKCTTNYCCSHDGYCGVGPGLCTNGCQYYYGVCYGIATNVVDDPPCDTGRFPGACYNNFCCGGTKCGLGPLYCGDTCLAGPCYHRPGTPAAVANTSAATLPAGSSAVQQS